MEDAKAVKLARKYDIGKDVAAYLVAAGFDSPARIQAASKSALLKVPGVGRAVLKKLKP